MSTADILSRANAAILRNDHEGFLEHCTEDTVWRFVGDITLEGKEAVRAWMSENYLVAPDFTVERLIEDGDHVVAIGEISVAAPDGSTSRHQYSDVWRLRDGKLAKLRAFVI